MTLQRYDTEYRAGFDVSPAERHLQGLVATTRRTSVAMAGALNPSSNAVNNLSSSLGPAGVAGAALLAGAAIAEIISTLRNLVGEASSIGKVADRLDVTTGFLQEFRHVAKLSGASVGETDKALEQFSKRLGEAVSKGGPLKDILEANNVAIRDANGVIRPTNDLLKEMSRLLANTDSSSVKATIANEAFGRSGLKMINVLQDGPDALQDNIEKARELGVAIDDDLIRKAEDLDDRWEDMTTRLATSMKSASLTVVAALADISSEMEKVSTDTVNFFNDPNLRDGLKALAGDGVADYFTDQTLKERLDAAFDDSGDKAPGNNDLRRSLLAYIARKNGSETVLPDPEDEEARKEKELEALRLQKELARAAKRRREAIQRVVESLAHENAQLGRSSEHQRLYNELRRAGVDINSEAGQQIAKLVGQINEQTQAEEHASKRMDGLIDQQRKFQDSLGHVTSAAFDTFEAFASGASTASEAIKKLAVQLAIAAAKGALLGQGPLAGLFGGGGVAQVGGGNPMMGGWNPMMGRMPHFAAGTNFAPGGWAVVGERGPEVVNLPRGSQVIPNHKISQSPNVSIRIINQGEPVSAKQGAQRQTGSGIELDVIIDEIAARKAVTPGSNLNSALVRQMGINTPLGSG